MQKIPNNSSSLIFFNTQFKFFLNFYISCLKLRQSILIYFDSSETTLSKNNVENELKYLCNNLKKYSLDINYIIDFIPGFISNSFSNNNSVASLLRPVFDVFFFLNYNPQNPRHVSLVNDLSTFRYEYVIFSPVNIDAFKISPYSFVRFNMNVPSLFMLFIQILVNAFERSKLNIFANVEKISILIFTIFYLRNKVKKKMKKKKKLGLTPKLFLEKMKYVYYRLPINYMNDFTFFTKFNYYRLMKIYYYYFYSYFYKDVITKIN
jgi:hypothetical protein